MTEQSYIKQERERCRALIEALLDEPKLLLYCIDNAYGVVEIDTARQRYNELVPDNFEDLM